jgi:hypothetical protein
MGWPRGRDRHSPGIQLVDQCGRHGLSNQRVPFKPREGDDIGEAFIYQHTTGTLRRLARHLIYWRLEG